MAAYSNSFHRESLPIPNPLHGDIERGEAHTTKNPTRVVREATVLLQNGQAIKAKLSMPPIAVPPRPEDFEDSQHIQAMIVRWQARMKELDKKLMMIQAYGIDSGYIHQQNVVLAEWNNLLSRINAAQLLLDYLGHGEV